MPFLPVISVQSSWKRCCPFAFSICGSCKGLFCSFWHKILYYNSHSFPESYCCFKVPLGSLQILGCSGFLWTLRKVFCYRHSVVASGVSLACFEVYCKIYFSHSFVLVCGRVNGFWRWGGMSESCSAAASFLIAATGCWMSPALGAGLRDGDFLDACCWWWVLVSTAVCCAESVCEETASVQGVWLKYEVAEFLPFMCHCDPNSVVHN